MGATKAPTQRELAKEEYFNQPDGFPFEGFELDDVLLPPNENMGIESGDDSEELEDALDAETGFGSAIGAPLLPGRALCSTQLLYGCAAGLTAAGRSDRRPAHHGQGGQAERADDEALQRIRHHQERCERRRVWLRPDHRKGVRQLGGAAAGERWRRRALAGAAGRCAVQPHAPAAALTCARAQAASGCRWTRPALPRRCSPR